MRLFKNRGLDLASRVDSVDGKLIIADNREPGNF